MQGLRRNRDSILLKGGLSPKQHLLGFFFITTKLLLKSFWTGTSFFTGTLHLKRKHHLQGFYGAIGNLQAHVLVEECPATFGNVVVHALEITEGVVRNLQKIY